MFTPRQSLILFALLAAACGDNGGMTMTTDKPLQCDTSKYVAFDATNHAAQDQQLLAQKAMLDAMDGTADDPSTAAASFAMAETSYKSGTFQSDVQAVKETHFDPPRAVGNEIDQTIIRGLMRGKTATTAVEADTSTEIVAKGMMRFFYTAIHQGITAGNAASWDRAQTYFGSTEDLTSAEKTAFAAFAAERDGKNGTNLTALIFNGFLDGSCELAKELKAKNATEVNVADVATLKPIVEKMDADMQKVVAYYVAHEALEMNALKGQVRTNPDPDLLDEMGVKLYELDLMFLAIEPLMSMEKSMTIRGIIDGAKNDASGGWKTMIAADTIVSTLEDEYGIDVRE